MNKQTRTFADWVVKISDFISKVPVLVAFHQFDIFRSFLVFLISSIKYGNIYKQVKTAFEIIVHSICLSCVIYTGGN